MSGVKLIAPEQRKFEQIGGEAGDIRVGRDVADDISKTFRRGNPPRNVDDIPRRPVWWPCTAKAVRLLERCQVPA